MSKDSILKIKSMDFAKRVIRLYQHLTLQKHEYILSKQIFAKRDQYRGQYN